jgi:hypothetical protein
MTICGLEICGKSKKQIPKGNDRKKGKSKGTRAKAEAGELRGGFGQVGLDVVEVVVGGGLD